MPDAEVAQEQTKSELSRPWIDGSSCKAKAKPFKIHGSMLVVEMGRGNSKHKTLKKKKKRPLLHMSSTPRLSRMQAKLTGRLADSDGERDSDRAY